MSDAASPSDGALEPMGGDELGAVVNMSGGEHWHAVWLWLSTLGDVVIAAACVSLAVLLLRTVRQRSDVPRGLLATAVCLLLLGVTHAVAAWNLWALQPWLLIGTKSAAAAAALVAAACSWRGWLQLLARPSQPQPQTTVAVQRSEDEMESFMSTVSHDLRSPLTTIAGQAGLLELSLGTHATEDLKRRVQRIHHSVRHMSQLIEALLALSRIGRHELHSEPLDISALAKQALGQLERKDAQRAVTISIQPGLCAHGDRELVADLLGHLLGNAWKFTTNTAAACIEVGATQDADAALYVRDNGAGFDMMYAAKLFKPFQRLHGPSEFGGAGIGLASAARIIARHGGKIWVQAAPHSGATFYFTLPRG